MMRTSSGKAAAGVGMAALVVLAGCDDGSDAPARHTLGGSVSGLAGSGLVLHSTTGDDLAITANGAFTFPSPVARGAAYAVTVKTQPSSPAQVCAVANGSGTMSSANVTDVAVTCTTPTPTFSVGGAVSGLSGGAIVLQNNGGDDVTLASSGPFTFATAIASGSAYAVTVKSKPEAQSCVVANGSGTMGASAVTNVDVTCTTNAHAVGGTITGLVGTGLVLHSDAGEGEDLTIEANATTFTFTQQATAGSTVNVSVKTQPTSPAESCTVSGSPVTIGNADVSSIEVSCTTAIQRWTAPATWGARWADSGTMVHHAYFDASGIVRAKGPELALEGTPAPDLRELGAFPSGTRHGAGPFVSSHYEATGEQSALDLAGDMLVCAIVKPDYDPVTEGHDPVIIAKGYDRDQAGLSSGWVLIQRHGVFNFQIRYADALGNNFSRMAYAPTYFANEGEPGKGPLNPTYLVVCAGRDGDTLRLAVNSFLPDGVRYSEDIPTPGAPLHTSSPPAPLTIGGYANGDPDHGYGGRIYETAVWSEPATPENLQAKLAAVLAVPDGAQYLRNREAPFVGADGQLHTAWRYAPRAHLADGSGLNGGYLFGLQGWNRLTVGTPATALGEDLGHALWAKSGGAVAVSRQLAPPGDSERPGAALVTLPPGASLSTQVGLFDSPGPIHAMAWIRPLSTSGTLTIETTQPDVTATSRHDVDLSTLGTDEWSYVWLSGLTTDASDTPATLALTNGGSSDLQFYAWGLVLTQIGGGADLGSFDPGPVMYDWGGASDGGEYALDYLLLPRVPVSTAASGFCLTADVQLPAGLSWTAPFEADRAALTWRATDGSGAEVNVFVGGRSNPFVTANDLCAHVSTLGASACWRPAWADGSKHRIGVCSTATGDLQLYADGAQVAFQSSAATPPDLANGQLIVGGNRLTGGVGLATWHGFISQVTACAGHHPTACR